MRLPGKAIRVLAEEPRGAQAVEHAAQRKHAAIERDQRPPVDRPLGIAERFEQKRRHEPGGIGVAATANRKPGRADGLAQGTPGIAAYVPDFPVHARPEQAECGHVDQEDPAGAKLLPDSSRSTRPLDFYPRQKRG